MWLAVRPVEGAVGVVRPLVRGRLEPLRVLDRQRAVAAVRRRVLRHHRELLAQLDAALQQARVEVEDVARVGLAARRAAQQQRELAVGLRLLRQVVVDAEGGLALLVHEVLGHRRAGVGGDVLQRRRVGRRGRDDDRVVHRADLAQLVDQADDRRLLEADGDVDADHVAAALVDDGVDRHRGLAGLAVADDQLALAAADRDHGVDRLDAGLQRLGDGLALGDAGGLELERPAVRGVDVPLAVERPAERIDDAADQLRADGDREQLARAAHLVPLLDPQVVAEDDGADRALLQVEHLPLGAVGELQALAGHGAGQAVDAGDAVAHLEHLADLREVDVGAVFADLFFDDRSDLVDFESHESSLPRLRLGNVGFAAMDLTRGARQQRLAQIVQPGRHAGVDLPPSTSTTRPPITDGSTFSISVGLRPVEAARACVEPLAQGGGERHGGADADVHPAAQVPQLRPVGDGDGAERGEPPLAVDHQERVDQQVARLAPEGLLDHLLAGLLLDQRAGQEALELRVAVEVRDEPVQLLEQLFGLPLSSATCRIASAYRRPTSRSRSSTFGHG